MIRTLDFSELSPRDALDVAILIEEEACERYQELAEQMETHHTAEAASFFRFMAANEAKHGEDLAARRKTVYGDAPRTVDRSMLWEVEAPEYDKVRAFMTARQALVVALDSEQKAFRFFDEATAAIADSDVRAMFHELREEELLHQDLIRKELAKLPADTAANVSDFADEPVAQ